MEKYEQKCIALERSLYTFKRKNAEREIMNARNLRLMRQQLDFAEHDRQRRAETQTQFKIQVAVLLEEIFCKDEEILRLKNQVKSDATTILSNGKSVVSTPIQPDMLVQTTFSRENVQSWDDDESLSPIFMATSRDDETASESDSEDVHYSKTFATKR